MANIKISELDAATTPLDGTESLEIIQSGINKKATVDEILNGTGTGDGDVVGPASNTDEYVPQWDGADSKTLKDGFPITTAGKSILDDADAAAQRATLGITQLVLPSAFYPGVPGDGAILLYVPIVVATTFPADFAGSVCSALVAATAITVIDIQRNGSDVGTITFQAASTTGVFSSTGVEVVFTAGDTISLVNQTTADGTLASVGVSLYGVR